MLPGIIFCIKFHNRKKHKDITGSCVAAICLHTATLGQVDIEAKVLLQLADGAATPRSFKCWQLLRRLLEKHMPGDLSLPIRIMLQKDKVQSRAL